MLYEDKLIEEPLNKYKLMKFLEKKLDRVGLASVDIQRTPIMTRITLEVMNPARIIGRRGKFINEFTEVIKKEFDIENPQISVIEVRNPYLEPRMVAKKATRYIETGKKVRAVLHFMLREIILSRQVYIMTCVLAFGTMLLSRLLMRAIDQDLASQGIVAYRVIMAGMSEQLAEFASRLSKSTSLCRIVGFADLGGKGEAPASFQSFPVLGSLSEIREIYDRTPFDLLVLPNALENRTGVSGRFP